MEDKVDPERRTVTLQFSTWKQLHQYKLNNDLRTLSEAIELLFSRHKRALSKIKQLKGDEKING